MNAQIEADYEEPDDVVEAGELTDEELEPVVGGLDHVWWPDATEPNDRS
jgi:hypothetical protein